MTEPTASWRNTTHDWARELDAGHIERVRREPVLYAPGGALHLVLEVLAYAADEAEATGSGRAVITLHDDGSVSIADDGRGTDTRVDDLGQTVKKPVMARPAPPSVSFRTKPWSPVPRSRRPSYASSPAPSARTWRRAGCVARLIMPALGGHRSRRWRTWR
jgi:hypothetical protein